MYHKNTKRIPSTSTDHFNLHAFPVKKIKQMIIII